MSTLEITGLTYVYGEGTPFEKKAIDDATFTVKEGRVTGIIGHTGSGKSTLVQMLNGIIKPKSGSVLLDGNDIYKNKKTLYEARFNIGLVFQYPEYQLFDETVRKDISFGPANMGLSAEEIEERVIEAAGFVSLDSDLLDRSPFELSGGQKRRAAIAGVLAMRPKVLILDEPASGLDPAGKNSIFEGLIEYKKKTNASVVIISHSMEDMAKYADDIVVLREGRIVLTGEKKDIFADPEMLIKAGLDLPSVTRIALKLREGGLDIPLGLYTTGELCDAIVKLKRGDKND